MESNELSGSDPMKKKWFFSKETINENESIGYWRCSNNHTKFCESHIGLQGMERRTMKTTLLIMAAGIGSRFGTGIKQLEPVDDAGHIIMDYSIQNFRLGSDPNVVNLSPECWKFNNSGLIFWIFYINVLTYPPKYVVYRLSNITLPAKYLSIPILRRYVIWIESIFVKISSNL